MGITSYNHPGWVKNSLGGTRPVSSKNPQRV